VTPIKEYGRKARWSAGSILLGAVLAFGVFGVAVNAIRGEAQHHNDDVYIEECGACHLAYPPGLLPVESWLGIMQNLEDHFGDNAETDDETGAYLTIYLAEHALKAGSPSRMSRMLRNMPDEPPLRITEVPQFVDAHHEIPEQPEAGTFDGNSLSRCADCHPQAEGGIFDEDQLSLTGTENGTEQAQ